MKKLFLISAVLVSISACSLSKDIAAHCKPTLVSGDIQTGSFDACLKCDSLAKVVYSNLNKQISKK